MANHPYQTTNPVLVPILERGVQGCFTPYEAHTLLMLADFAMDESQPMCDRAIAVHRSDAMTGAPGFTVEEISSEDVTAYVAGFVEIVKECL